MNEGILGATSESPEIIEKFKERGHPLGRTNVVKQTWNKLWVEKKAGNLIHLPKLGYWLPNEPLSEEDKAKAAAARAERLKASRKGPESSLFGREIRAGGSRRFLTSSWRLRRSGFWKACRKPKLHGA